MIEIIPAIDIIDGKCVRLAEGDFTRCTVYSGDPVEMASRFEDAGLKRLHLVDLEGAKQGRPANLSVLESIAAKTSLVIDFGGGIAADRDLVAVFAAGASIATVGSTAVRSPSLFARWIGEYGPDRFLLGADVRGLSLAIDGWRTITDVGITDLLSHWVKVGIANVFVTDIAKDGLLRGASVKLYRDLLNSIPALNLIASGGVSSLEDIRHLEEAGCSGVIIGKAIYEGRIKLNDLALFN
ncbi:MAG: 1-(5-phosphoribosyl)-5-[(5-phosphoribosylamino)methylideneamino] imidazole-4-carboxamide isomerase [Acidobacteria bacterium]|nr:1-(5-phosphoribosyl)-5-[(5-phosphoribosylamino)methylideneamino] imidazole-4-carboxamide isomerase [Acidobacteriota bacterium]